MGFGVAPKRAATVVIGWTRMNAVGMRGAIDGRPSRAFEKDDLAA